MSHEGFPTESKAVLGSTMSTGSQEVSPYPTEKRQVRETEDIYFGDDIPKGQILGEQESKYGHLKRGLKSRQIQMLAIGGAIGTGLFVGSGQVLADSGPAPLLMSYIIMSFVMWTIMNVLGEMTTYLPVTGVSPPYFVERFADKSLAFAASWIYWYSYAFLVPSEITAAAIVVEYWTHRVPTAAWIAIILVVIVSLNIFVVSAFGEAEFWFASIKVITILGLIIVGIVIFFGGTPTHDRLGFRYWKHGEAFQQLMGVPGAAGRFCAFWNAMVKSGFSFITSPELIVIAAGEAQAPRRNIPKAVRRFIWRLLFFYILGSLVIGVIVSSKSPRLLSALNSGSSDAAASPFVIGIQNAGIPVLNHIINAAILTSAWSAGNAFMFAGSRILYSQACNGDAPKIFKTCNRWGVPYLAVGLNAAIACLAFLNVSSSSANVFTWFTNLSTIGGFIGWICCLIAYLRFRKAMNFNGILDSLPFKTRLQPWASIGVLVFLIILTLTNGFRVFLHTESHPHFVGADFVAAYITLPIFIVLWFGHKLWFRNWRWFIPVEEVDVTSDLDVVDAIEAMYPDREPKNALQRFWYWLA